MQSFNVYARVLTRAIFNGVQTYSSDSITASKSDLRASTANQHQLDPLNLITASSGFPKDLSNSFVRKDQFGDDACFITSHSTADVIGVADGVGGWRTYGIDPSLFSSELMRKCEHLVKTGQFNPHMPAKIIARSFYELRDNKEEIIGSSTACLVSLDKYSHNVYTANIGDSGYLVVREGKVLHRSKEQTHYFNTPHQLSKPPPEQTGQVLSDMPETADLATFIVQEGDLILVATDGLFDNVPEQLIVNELSNLKDHKVSGIQATVNSLALQARTLAYNPKYESPFTKRAREHGINAMGGKPDDIAIVLASVSS